MKANLAAVISFKDQAESHNFERSFALQLIDEMLSTALTGRENRSEQGQGEGVCTRSERRQKENGKGRVESQGRGFMMIMENIS